MKDTSLYFDTSSLLKLYNEENGSREVIAIAQSQAIIPLSFIGEMELRNSLRVLYGRKRIHAEELEQALLYIEEDIASGRLQRLHPDPLRIENQCFELSRLYSADNLCRTLDILHVATAIISNIKHFVTCDKRQAQLAAEVGLNLSYIDLSKTL
ncbi:type II toxin-antitoxin system VapC family toxin [Coraliomargarita sp. SDUM461003]|uniref:Type II toxin-antitoxin system VapC family toxin n=1 Tax=Thalassobacterium maritimum TaxID=3041265 RepID=A0ABU1AR22_9BACT|nr:type II toxin-antitoxin system VapC family toxin [Coraliomargarita sp. SDUM461003]MDQ8206609.1 type II toxin-antitoxin system VapC family toxin [Coraliomargarita sp. SDUM461003]